MKHIVTIILTLAFTLTAVAQTLKVRPVGTVSVGQTFRVIYEVDARPSDFQGPTFKGFSVRGGPQTGYSSSIVRVNGKTTASETHSFTYLVCADQEGSFTIGPATCVVDGKKLSSGSLTVKVVKADPSAAQNQRQSNAYGGYGGYGYGQSQPQQQAQSPTIDQNSLFARASLSKSNPYEGEEVIITYKIYTQVSLRQYQIDKLPGNRGFWSEDLSEGKEVRTYNETLNGKNYQVAEIRRGALYAQESGKLKIEPLNLEVLAVVPVQRRRTGTILDLFDDPFFNRGQAVQKALSSNALTVNVKPLPEAPDGFYGAVGQYSVKAEIDNPEVKANEAITLRLTVSGHGNLSLLQAPELNLPKVFEVYEPKTTDKITRGDNGLSGSRTFEWVIIPQSQGNYTIPAITYAYFNPSAGSYTTLKTQPIEVQVAKGDGSGKSFSTSKNDVKMLNSDINHIKTSTGQLRIKGAVSRPSMLQWILLAVVFLSGVVSVLLGRRQQQLNSDVQGSKMRHALRLAQRRLKTAEKYLADGDDNKFYEEIYKALWGCLSDKYAIALSQLSRETVQDKLQEIGIPEDKMTIIMHTLDDVDQARFAPGDSSQKKQAIYSETLQTIASLQ